MEMYDIKGLSPQLVAESRTKYGPNSISSDRESGLWYSLKSLAKEPMVILLFVASAIYFINGAFGDGLFLATAIILVSVISLYQDSRSRNALAQLKALTKPDARVIRDGKVQQIKTKILW